MGWFSGSGTNDLSGIPNDSGALLIRPDGKSYTEDAVLRGSLDDRILGTDHYDRVEFQLLPGFEYLFENYFDSSFGLYEIIILTETETGRSLLNYVYLTTDLIRDATSTTLPLTVSAPTNVTLLISAVGPEANRYGTYEIDIYANPVPISTFGISAADADKVEGSAGVSYRTPYTFTVTRQGFTADFAVVNWSVSSAAASGDDFYGYSFPSGYLFFNEGETSKTVTIEAHQDTQIEADEQFTVHLDSVTDGNVIGVGSAIGTIRSDDLAVVFSIASLDASHREGAAGASAPFTFAIARTGNTAVASAVSWSIAGSQIDGADFALSALPSGYLSFAAGETSKIISVYARGDSLYEAHERFTASLSIAPGSAGVVITTPTAQGVIQNDDSSGRMVPAGPGKDASFLFDPVFYLWESFELVPGLKLQDSLANYLAVGAAAGKQPTSWFDAAYYEQRWADLTPLHLDDATLFAHFNLFGVWEGRSPGPKFDHFDGNRYLAENQDVAAYVDAYVGDFLGSRTNGAIAHYIIYGSGEGRAAHDTEGGSIDLGYIT